MVFGVILILWAGSCWWFVDVTMGRERKGPEFGVDGAGIYSSDGYFATYAFHFPRITLSNIDVGFEFRPTERQSYQDFLRYPSREQVNLGLARWYILQRGKVGFEDGFAIEIHYAPLAVIAGFLTWRSWRKRRRRDTRGFEVASGQRAAGQGDASTSQERQGTHLR